MTPDDKITPEDKVKKPTPPAAGSETETDDSSEDDAPRPDPTRYGDWEKGGRCIDF